MMNVLTDDVRRQEARCPEEQREEDEDLDQHAPGCCAAISPSVAVASAITISDLFGALASGVTCRRSHLALHALPQHAAGHCREACPHLHPIQRPCRIASRSKDFSGGRPGGRGEAYFLRRTNEYPMKNDDTSLHALANEDAQSS